MMSALCNAEFVRKGVMHRNLFVCAPAILDGFLRPKGKRCTFFAGQITSVEGVLRERRYGACFIALYVRGSDCVPDVVFP